MNFHERFRARLYPSEGAHRWRWKAHVRLTQRLVWFLYCAPWSDRSGRRLRTLGTSLAVPWRGEWLRPHLSVVFGLDDGCANFYFDALMYRASKQTQSKPDRVYINNTKRYFKFVFRFRYRGRKVVTREAQ